MAEMKKTPCPNCKEELNDSTAQAGQDPTKKPKPGDWTICGYCASVLKFNQQLDLEHVIIDEQDALKISKPDEYAALMKAREFVKAMSFGRRYGASNKTLLDRATTPDEAAIVKTFFEKFPERS